MRDDHRKTRTRAARRASIVLIAVTGLLLGACGSSNSRSMMTGMQAMPPGAAQPMHPTTTTGAAHTPHAPRSANLPSTNAPDNAITGKPGGSGKQK